MRTRARVALVTAAGIIASLAFSSPVINAQKDEKKEQRKLDKSERQELDALSAAVDSAVGGQPTSNTIDLTWVQNFFMKAQGGKEYVPFTVSVDASGLANTSAALYVRLVNREAISSSGAKPAQGDSGAQVTKTEAPTPPPYEYIHFLDLKPEEAGQCTLVSRALLADAGDYDLYLALKERGTKKGTAAKMSVIKQPLTIPNFWQDELTTSSILLVSRAEPLTTPVAPEQQLDNPFSLGAMKLVPSLDKKFSKQTELNVYFWVYNPTVDAAKKPDVTIEFAFHQKTGDVEKYFNKTNPLRLNAQSLAPDFDMDAGHQLNGGQSIRLGSFPEGEYRLEIKVTDNVSKKTVSRDVRFTVAA